MTTPEKERAEAATPARSKTKIDTQRSYAWTRSASNKYQEIDWAALKVMSIAAYLRARGHELHRGRCACPIHNGDNKTKFAVKNDRRWYCPDCGSGDLVALDVLLSGGQANSKIHRVLAAKRLLGIPDEQESPEERERRRAKLEHQKLIAEFEAEVEAAKPKYKPELRTPTKSEFRDLSALRSIEVRPLIIAARRGLLFASDDFYGQRCWVITDRNREIHAARRVDGQPWTDNAKDRTRFSAGGNASWPIGISHTKGFPAIAVCEGFPDFLAAIAHAWASGVEGLVAPVYMTSSGASIDERALPYFKGKRVRIFFHNDAPGKNGKRPGYEAAARWKRQLEGVASKVDRYSLAGLTKVNGDPVKDLNDLLLIDPDSWEQNRTEIESFMHFATEGRN